MAVAVLPDPGHPVVGVVLGEAVEAGPARGQVRQNLGPQPPVVPSLCVDLVELNKISKIIKRKKIISLQQKIFEDEIVTIKSL